MGHALFGLTADMHISAVPTIIPWDKVLNNPWTAIAGGKLLIPATDVYTLTFWGANTATIGVASWNIAFQSDAQGTLSFVSPSSLTIPAVLTEDVFLTAGDKISVLYYGGGTAELISDLFSTPVRWGIRDSGITGSKRFNYPFSWRAVSNG